VAGVLTPGGSVMGLLLVAALFNRGVGAGALAQVAAPFVLRR
jgi:hypothetical protein